MLIYGYLLVLETLVGNDIFLALGCVEIDGQFDALRLIDSQRQVRLLLQIFQTETLEIFLGEGLSVEDSGGRSALRLAWRTWHRSRSVQGLIPSLLTMNHRRSRVRQRIIESVTTHWRMFV